jgi:uncharacterized protein YodC (DUF2158 family)
MRLIAKAVYVAKTALSGILGCMLCRWYKSKTNDEVSVAITPLIPEEETFQERINRKVFGIAAGHSKGD